MCKLLSSIHFHYFIFKFGSFLPKTHKCTSCRSRQELSNEYLLANFGVDTADKQASQSLPRISQMIEKTSKKVRKNLGRLRRGVRSPLDSRTERGPRGGRNVAAADPPPRPCPAGGLRRGERAAASARLRALLRALKLWEAR